jgi:NADH-quinone oxidoreductase subunit N
MEAMHGRPQTLMNYSLTILEMAVVLLGMGVLLVDLWTPVEMKRQLGYAAAAALGMVLLFSFSHFVDSGTPTTAFNGMYVQDGLSLFFKRFFLVTAIIVLIMAVDFSDRIAAGISEYFSLILFALSGMMFAASAFDFTLLFVAIELITVTFYVLTSFQRSRLASLEAGVKYLILGALSSAFLVFGIALVFGTTGHMNFGEIARVASQFSANKVFLLGLLLVLVGLGFKIAAFPFQLWAPDVYQGSPTPTTAFLAVGSKAAGFVLLLRVLFNAVPEITAEWTKFLIAISAITILYGNLCAIPQRNLKRLLGYSSISNAGYMLLGVAALSSAGQSAVLYYLGGYLFTVLAAFAVIALVMREAEGEDIGALAGLDQRSPFLAGTLTLAMVSLAGIPPLAGFFGKFLLLKAAVEQGAGSHAYYWLVAIALVGVVISIYYYFGVVRAIYWSKHPADLPSIQISTPIKTALYACIGGMLFLGLFPNPVVNSADQAVVVLKGKNRTAVAPTVNELGKK